MSIELTNHQWDAVKLAVDWYKDADNARYKFESYRNNFSSYFGERETGLGKGQDFFFGGFAGTGKTTVLPAVIEEMRLQPSDVAFVAPTGKAAKVMGGKLHDFGMQVTPTTIHKLIYLPKLANADRIQSKIKSLQESIHIAGTSGDPEVPFEGGYISFDAADKKLKQLNFDLARAMDNDDGPTFSLRSMEDIKEEIKLFVVDEGSMVGLDLAVDLASFGRPILAFGDPGQLPPVADHYGFSCETPDAFLTEIHRQAKDNPIIQLATKARNGESLKIGDYGGGVRVVDRRNDDVTYDMSREAMVLCGTHKKRWNLTKGIRNALGYTETGPCSGEPLLYCKNSSKLETMVNGTVVTCLTDSGNLRKGAAEFDIKIKDDEGGGAEYDITVVQGLFEEHIERKRNAYSAPAQSAFHAKKNYEHLDFGHALTVHKSQGSQWDDVVVHDESGAFRDAASRWLYTGITRAAKQLTVVV